VFVVAVAPALAFGEESVIATTAPTTGRRDVSSTAPVTVYDVGAVDEDGGVWVEVGATALLLPHPIKQTRTNTPYRDI
jgi:hypothetical protein